MVDYLIYKARKVAGVVRDGPDGTRVIEGDDEFRQAVAAALAEPAWEMFGGEIAESGILWDGVRIFNPGEPGHVRAAMTANRPLGTLAKRGYYGREAGPDERAMS